MNELYIYDDIGPDWLGLISGKSVVTALKDIDPESDLTVRINSPGGSVDEAKAIYNALSRRPGPVTVEVDGIAASAASYIAMAGKTIRMAENALMMIHAPWTYAIGNAEELRRTADIVEMYESGIIDVYAARTTASREDIVQWVSEETWFDAEQAVGHGFADEIGQSLRVAASMSSRRFVNMPKRDVNDKPHRQKSLHSAELMALQIDLTRRRQSA